MKNNVIKEKSYSFALKIIDVYKYLIFEKKEYVLSKQLLKSGTSIGANVEEALGGQSRKDFFSKMMIAYKEARESHYWLRLIKDSNLMENNVVELYLNDCNELLKIMGSIRKTMHEVDNF